MFIVPSIPYSYHACVIMQYSVMDLKSAHNRNLIAHLWWKDMWWVQISFMFCPFCCNDVGNIIIPWTVFHVMLDSDMNMGMVNNMWHSKHTVGLIDLYMWGLTSSWLIIIILIIHKEMFILYYAYIDNYKGLCFIFQVITKCMYL